MKNRKLSIGLAMLGCAVLAAGVIMASNMGFKLTKGLLGPGDADPAGGTSPNGTNIISLPYFRMTGITIAQDLRADIGALEVSRFRPGLNNTFQVWSGARGQTNFALVDDQCYLVRVGAASNYPIVGSHNPALTVNLLGPGDADPAGGTSPNGTNCFNFPYHSTALVAQDLRAEIGALEVSRFRPGLNNTFQVWSGARGQTNFTLVPGEGYLVRVGAATSFTPDHF